MAWRKLTIRQNHGETEIAEWIKTLTAEWDIDDGEEYEVYIKVKPKGVKAKTSWKRVKSDPVHTLAANYVKQRDNHQCRKCGFTVFGKNKQSAHIFPRRIASLTYDYKNLLTMCAKDHDWFDDGKDLWDDANEKTAWLIEQIGLDALIDLRLTSQMTAKKKDEAFRWKTFYERVRKNEST